MPMGSGFKVGGYGASPSIYGKMDEFRMWRRALSPSEVAALWNSDLGGCGITGISETGNEIPQKFTLSQNYPNPFNPSTTIKYSLPKGENVKLVVYDALGREVKTLVNEFKNSGVYSVNFDASSLSSGIYFYKIEAGSFTETKKMLLVK
ncbi:MAG: T9SS type A sorting domain-containing protein [Ignavibacteria bacterium]|nr:T9SS type A sorting domain-containing protein [Ignavibacteria bacterium]